jgi:enterochelin esterase family protein
MIILFIKRNCQVTICLFVNPGHNTKDYPENRFRASNRADEYDVLDDRYATMLMDEIIPELKKKYNISNDPKMHGIGGLSSGAICAFTAAWEHPEYFP